MHEFFLSAHYAIAIFLLAVATEAVIELVKESDISVALIHPPITNRWRDNPTWYNYTIYKWITCGQCMSVIYSIPGAMYLSTWFAWYHSPIVFLISLFVLQRTTNWLNTAYKLLARGRITAIELMSPLIKIEPDMNYDRESLLSSAVDREFRRGNEDKVIIKSVQDVIRIIDILKKKKPGSGRVVSLNIGEGQFNINTSTDHPPYMEMIKEAIGDTSHNVPSPAIEINGGEQVIPINIGSSHIIDGFIARCAGGTRDGNRIKWVLPDGDYFYDPIADKLTKAMRTIPDQQDT